MPKTGSPFFCVAMVFFGLTSEQALGQSSKSVDVQVVRFAELAKLVDQNKGKVVVVDFWATFCPPCLKELPHVVQMNQKYSASGLITITVSLDQLKSDAKIKQKVLDTLKKADARLINVLLDEDFSDVQKKFRFEGPPCVFVFNRQGKWVEFKEEQFRHDLIEQTVIQFLKGQ